MSRIGVIPIPVPDGVELTVQGRSVAAKGKLGELRLELTGSVAAQLEDGAVVVSRGDESKQSKSLHGLYQRLISNMVAGVSEGFRKVLLINGVGYRAEVQGDTLTLNVGFSQPVEYAIPEGASIEVADTTRVTVSGCDRQIVGQVASEIRGFRPPEPYKGKGIRYEDEHVRRKAGKSAVSAA